MRSQDAAFGYKPAFEARYGQPAQSEAAPAPLLRRRSLHRRCEQSCCRGAGRCRALCGCAARWALPTAVAGCAAVFLWSQQLVGAIIWAGAQITMDGEMNRFPALNTTYWQSIQDGWQSGARASQALNAFCSGVWPFACMLALWVLWFVPRPRAVARWATVTVLTTKWISWYLVFACIQALAFQYRVTIALFPPPLTFIVLLDVDIQASDGVFLLSAGIFTLQILGNVVFIADRALPNGAEPERSRRGSEVQAALMAEGGGGGGSGRYPLFLAVFWRCVTHPLQQSSCRLTAEQLQSSQADSGAVRAGPSASRGGAAPAATTARCAGPRSASCAWWGCCSPRWC